MQVYSTPGTFSFTVPSGITKILIEVWGAGGGGGNNSVSATGGTSGGGGGGYGKQIFTVTPNTNYSVTIGQGGTAGQNGGTSSVGSLISATGGTGGMSIGIPVLYPVGGSSSAAFNINGETGRWSGTGGGLGGEGGGSFNSGGGRGATNGVIAEPGITPGGGGGAGAFQFAGYTSGAIGGNGRVVIWY